MIYATTVRLCWVQADAVQAVAAQKGAKACRGGGLAEHNLSYF